MSFSSEWLALRIDADREARDPGLVAELAVLAEARETLCIVDLGAGTGANMKALSPVLNEAQHWHLVDADAGLLAEVEAADGVTATTHVIDLAGSLDPLFDLKPDLMTASAFFDLAGAEWVEALVSRVAASGALFYTSLTYDGRETWAPAHPHDAAVLAAFHADQRRDKGLGPAAGPDATTVLERAFRSAGYTVVTARSDWKLTAKTDGDLIAMLAEGAAAAVRPALGDVADEWLAARRSAGSVEIGHLDLLAVPKGWEPADPQ